jgi:hypothetical protein
MNFSSKKLTKMIIFNFALFLFMAKFVNLMQSEIEMWSYGQGEGSPEIQEVQEEQQQPSSSGVYGNKI